MAVKKTEKVNKPKPAFIRATVKSKPAMMRAPKKAPGSKQPDWNIFDGDWEFGADYC